MQGFRQVAAFEEASVAQLLEELRYSATHFFVSLKGLTLSSAHLGWAATRLLLVGFRGVWPYLRPVVKWSYEAVLSTSRFLIAVYSNLSPRAQVLVLVACGSCGTSVYVYRSSWFRKNLRRFRRKCRHGYHRSKALMAKARSSGREASSILAPIVLCFLPLKYYFSESAFRLIYSTIVVVISTTFAGVHLMRFCTIPPELAPTPGVSIFPSPRPDSFLSRLRRVRKAIAPPSAMRDPQTPAPVSAEVSEVQRKQKGLANWLDYFVISTAIDLFFALPLLLLSRTSAVQASDYAEKLPWIVNYAMALPANNKREANYWSWKHRPLEQPFDRSSYTTIAALLGLKGLVFVHDLLLFLVLTLALFERAQYMLRLRSGIVRCIERCIYVVTGIEIKITLGYEEQNWGLFSAVAHGVQQLTAWFPVRVQVALQSLFHMPQAGVLLIPISMVVNAASYVFGFVLPAALSMRAVEGKSFSTCAYYLFYFASLQLFNVLWKFFTRTRLWQFVFYRSHVYYACILALQVAAWNARHLVGHFRNKWNASTLKENPLSLFRTPGRRLSAFPDNRRVSLGAFPDAQAASRRGDVVGNDATGAESKLGCPATEDNPDGRARLSRKTMGADLDLRKRNRDSAGAVVTEAAAAVETAYSSRLKAPAVVDAPAFTMDTPVPLRSSDGNSKAYRPHLKQKQWRESKGKSYDGDGGSMVAANSVKEGPKAHDKSSSLGEEEEGEGPCLKNSTDSKATSDGKLLWKEGTSSQRCDKTNSVDSSSGVTSENLDSSEALPPGKNPVMKPRRASGVRRRNRELDALGLGFAGPRNGSNESLVHAAGADAQDTRRRTRNATRRMSRGGEL